MYGQLGLDDPFLLKPKALTLTNVQKIVAARNYSLALLNSGEVYAWGQNHYGQLGRPEEVLAKPTLVTTGCLDVEGGEGAVVLSFEDCLKIAGFSRYRDFTRVEVQARPAHTAAGDTFVAYVDKFGEVWHIGGLFKGKRNSFWMRTPELRFEKADSSLFPGRVKKIFGKYSYHAAIVEE